MCVLRQSVWVAMLRCSCTMTNKPFLNISPPTPPRPCRDQVVQNG